MRKYESQRGSILLESTAVVGAIFLMLFGTVSIAIIGFDQMSADGASYEVAHQTSVSASATPNAFAHQLYPNIPQAQISAYLQPAPASSISVDYGYNGDTAAEQQSSDNNRHGGVSVVQGTEVKGVATKNSSSLLGMPISVIGGMVEPMWVENGIHFDVENDDTYGGTSANCAPVPSPSPSPTGGATAAPGKCFSGSIFTTGENTPPYFIGFNFMTHCQQAIPWSTGQSGGSGDGPFLAQPYDCSQSLTGDQSENKEGYTPMGVAEYLNLANWCGTTSSPCPVAPANPGLAGSKAADATFALIACHQRVYAQIATFFQNNPSLQGVYSSIAESNAPTTNRGGTPVGNYSTVSGALGPAYYYWDLFWGPGSGVSGVGSNSFTVWAGYDSSAAQEQANWANGATPNPSMTVGPTDSLIRQVYSWDASDINASGPNTTNPGNGC